MENINQNPLPEMEVTGKQNDFQERIERFFTRMDYNDDQKAMFYLGRVLSSVAAAQVQAGHSSKPF